MSTAQADAERDAIVVTKDAIREVPPEETRTYYTKWAADYDQDVVGARYNGPEIFLKGFLPLGMPKTLRILDIGAGTGTLGQRLKQLGYDNIDALDACGAMLEKAKAKGIYHNHIEAMILADKQLDIPSESYDVVIGVGCFIPGHIPVEAFRELVRITKKGGIVCWAKGHSNNYAHLSDRFKGDCFERELDKMVTDGLWRSLDGYPLEFEDYYEGKPGVFSAMRVL